MTKPFIRSLLLCSLLCGLTFPLGASSDYSITETEVKSHPNPLSILSGRVQKTPSLQPQSSIEKILSSTQKPISKIERKQTAKLTISALPIQRSYPVDRSHKKIIYLTFDDGPLRGTRNVMRVLREEGVDATMFFVGKHIVKRRALFRQAIAMPNLLIANHTYSHANGKYARFYSNVTRVVSDINRAQAIIGGAKYLRLAGRNVWRMPQVNRDDYALSTHRRSVEHAKYEALSSRGYQIYGWDIEWNFNAATGRAAYGADHMASRIERLYNSRKIAKSGKVILLTHDYMFRGQSGSFKLRELIRILRANGWEFQTIDDYSSSTPDIFMGKAHKRSANPFDSMRAIQWKTALEHMVANSFTSQTLKSYLHPKNIHPTQTTKKDTPHHDTLEIVLGKHETTQAQQL